ncbi:hypothetical protein SLS62_003035 [Diatrype stigma]|uniref:Rhodopsin domain-containing protein n=1 Tax=Diatrype stigma TaxID=117547 RepID=A0AAN9UWS1_9PEZI
MFDDMPDVYLAEPPAGQVRTLIDPPTRQASILAVAAATTAIAAVAVGIRFYTRTRIVGGRISIDDTFVLISSLLTFISIALNYQPTLPLSPQTWFRVMVYGLIGTVSCYSVIYVFFNVFPCRPVAAAWDLNIDEARCIDAWNAYYALSILNILMDAATLVLPVPVVIGLNISARQKVSLILLFATGIFVCAIAIRRTVLIPSLIATKDRTWDVGQDYIFSYLEVNAGIVCASVPALKPFFLRFLPSMVTSPRTTRDRNTAQKSFGQKSFGLTTAAEQNRQRRMMQQRTQSYELSSVDNGRHFDKGPEDEEAKLWSPVPSDNGIKGTTKSKDTESISINTLEDSNVPMGVNETIVSSPAEPSHPLRGVIHVRQETVVQFDRA